MLRLDLYVIAMGVVASLVLSTSCSTPGLSGSDAGMLGEAGPVGDDASVAVNQGDAGAGSQSGADVVSPPGPVLPPPPRHTIDSLVDLSTGVFSGTVRSIQVDAAIDEFKVAGVTWRIHYDEITVASGRSIGAAATPAMVLRLIPNHCEGFDEQGQLLPSAQISTCTGRNTSNGPVVGATIIGFVSGRDILTLFYALPVMPGGDVDFRNIDDAPRDVGELQVWALIQERWNTLGRGG
jgi:hypothetical protein